MVKIDKYGTKKWFNSKNESYCIEYSNGDKFWYQNDLLHRIDGPAIEWSNGTKEWHQNGKRHRIDGPAIEWHNGNKNWYQNGLLHCVEYSDGAKLWLQNEE